MSSHEAYLRTALGKYQYKDLAKRDILQVFTAFSDLRPMKNDFVFNDGSRKELLCLDGTIPVNYRGQTYNIPVSLWLLETHPYNPPMVYVKPTSSMRIKQGRHVDSNGKIYLPYLHEWRHPQSDLTGLIQILTIIFGEEPPVFAANAAQPSGYQPHAGPTTPYPAQGSTVMPTPSFTGSTTTGYPPSTSAYPPSTYPSYAPYTATSYPASGNTTSASGYPGYGANTQTASTTHPTRMPEPKQSPSPSKSPSLLRSLMPNVMMGVIQKSTMASQPSLSEEQIRASLLSAVEDKMRRRLKEIFAQSQAEMDSLNRTKDDLQKGKQTLDSMLQKLEKEQNDVERNIAVLNEKNEEISVLLEKMDKREEVNIDEAVVAPAPLYKQLLNSFAEEQATEDAIYYLAEGLKRGVIDLDIYLKTVRELSRKQFMLRALIQKCREKAGLPEATNA